MPLFRRPSRGLGCLVDDRGGTMAYGIGSLGVMSGAGAPSEFSLEQHAKHVLDQGPTSSCVAHAFAAAIHITEDRAGLPFQPVSRRFIYANARVPHSADVLGVKVMTDNGTYLRTAAEGLRRFGAPDERWFDWASGRVAINRKPTWEAMCYAHGRGGGKYAKIYGFGEYRVPEIQAALLAGYPVAFGTRVASSFLDSRGPLFIDRPSVTDPIAGNHAMLIVGWKTVEGRLWFRVQNSWGTSWRDHGFTWLSSEYVCDLYTQDLHIIGAWNNLREAAA